jgi:hypothetical protein
MRCPAFFAYSNKGIALSILFLKTIFIGQLPELSK